MRLTAIQILTHSLKLTRNLREIDVDALSDADVEFDSDCDVDVDALSEAETEFDSNCDVDVDALSDAEIEFDSD